MKSLDTGFCMAEAHDCCGQEDAGSGGARRTLFAATVALAVVLGGTGALFAQDGSSASPRDAGAGPGRQVAALYELQAAFHRASTVRDPVNGDADYVIQQRIQAVLSLWADNGWILFNVGSPRDGYYMGKGDPADPSTCPAPSDNSANRGTLCTFFKYVAAPFQAANKLVSLAPSYKTDIHASGSDASMYFECHFFNVAPNPATGGPLWAAAGHLAVDGRATRVGQQWLFSSFNVQPTGVPLP
jgi:hypothetical protein